MDGIFVIFISIGAVLFLAVLIFSLMMMFGTKTRAKMLSRQIESISGATNMSKEDIENVLTNLSSATINSKKKILEENEDVLKDIKDAETRINKDAIRESARAVKEGFVDSKIYCKHCGASIDSDSKFCKSCGKEI